MKTFRLVVIWVVWAGLACPLQAQEKQEGGWSADLLRQILKAETPKADTSATSSTVPTEMVLHTYHLTTLRVGEAGKPQNVLTILRKLLPTGSAINTDVPANSLHILTTTAAHKAAWDYLSAVDVADMAPQPASNAVPEEVKAALKKLADAGEQSTKLLTTIAAMKTDVSNELAAIDARQRQQMFKLLMGGGGFALLLIGTIMWMLRRRAAPMPSEQPAESAALVLAPEQLTTALTPVHDKMRNDMLGLLNEVAIKLQAQHNEQQKLVLEQQKQLEDARVALAEERRQFISEAGTMVVQAVERVDATTAKLAKQQDKVAELVEELQVTVRELDETKDSLRTKEIELEQERSKIAALSILLEEGGAVPSVTESSPFFHNGRATGVQPPAEANGNHPMFSPPSRPAPSTPCTNPDQTPVSAATAMGLPTTTSAEALQPPRFKFLPPDHPES